MSLEKDTVNDLQQFSGEDLKARETETVLEIEIDNKIKL